MTREINLDVLHKNLMKDEMEALIEEMASHYRVDLDNDDDLIRLVRIE